MRRRPPSPASKRGRGKVSHHRFDPFAHRRGPARIQSPEFEVAAELALRRQQANIALGGLGGTALRLCRRRQHEAERAFAGCLAEPAQAMIQLIGAVADEIGRAVRQQLHAMGPAARVGQRIQGQHELGIDRGARVNDLVSGGILLEPCDKPRIFLRRNERRRQSRSHSHKGGGNAVDQHGANDRTEVDMREIHQLHRRMPEIADPHLGRDPAAPPMELDGRLSGVMPAEGDPVMIAAGQAHEGTRLVAADDELRLLIAGVGQLAMDGMPVLQTRISHRRGAAMEKEGAIGLKEIHIGDGRLEHRAHGEPPAEECRVPDLLTLEGQCCDMSQLIGDAQTGDAAAVVPDRGGQPRMARQHRLDRAKLLGLEIDDHII